MIEEEEEDVTREAIIRTFDPYTSQMHTTSLAISLLDLGLITWDNVVSAQD